MTPSTKEECIHIILNRIRHQIDNSQTTIHIPNVFIKGQCISPSDTFDDISTKDYFQEKLSNASRHLNIQNIKWNSNNTTLYITYSRSPPTQPSQEMRNFQNMLTQQTNALQRRKENEDEKLNICGICLTSMSLDQGRCIIQTPCDHTFHYECLHKWFASSHSCPECRTHIRIKN